MDVSTLSPEARAAFEGLHPRMQNAIRSLTGKRAELVIALILEEGGVSTGRIARAGYEHAPRAARDVREQVVPLNTNYVRSSEGKRIASYSLGDPDDIERNKLGGRSTLPKRLKDDLYRQNGGRCDNCYHQYKKRYLQVDHRVPYGIGGDIAGPSETDAYMLLCGSCQRSKSWSCKHCPNWDVADEAVCRSCYWFDPADYEHIATVDARRLEVTFTGREVQAYDEAEERARRQGLSVNEYVKRLMTGRRAPSDEPDAPDEA